MFPALPAMLLLYLKDVSDNTDDEDFEMISSTLMNAETMEETLLHLVSSKSITNPCPRLESPGALHSRIIHLSGKLGKQRSPATLPADEIGFAAHQ